MSLDERMVVARVERLTLGDLRRWVREGLVRPAEGAGGPVFDELDVARIRLLRDLTADMALPPDSLPVVLMLIDRLHETRRAARCLAQALGEQPPEVRDAVLSSYRRRQGGA